MVSSDWASQAHNQTHYSANELKALSYEIQQGLQAGGKKVVRGYPLMTKEVLLKKALAKGLKVSSALTKAQIINKLRGKKSL